MKDFLLLVQSPSELYRKGRNNVSIGIPVALYLAISFLSVIALYYGVETGSTKQVLEMMPTAMPVVIISGMIGTIIGLVLYVQIIYYTMILYCKLTEDVIFEKKQVKKLIYLAQIIPALPISLLQILFMFLTKTELPLFLSLISGAVRSILSCLMISYTMKTSMETKKAHVIYPVLLFAVFLLIQLVSFFSTQNSMSSLGM